MAQMAAANIGGGFPQCWIDILRKFEDECPYEPMSVVRSIVEQEYPGYKFDEIFEYFDPKPLGSASIGQVHRARLHQSFYDENMSESDIKMNDPLDIVIKIQYPSAEELFRGDLLLTRKFAKMAQPEHLVYIDEMEIQFKTEFDYVGEADNLLLVGNHINSHPEWSKKVVIPVPYKPLCTRLCLIMEYISGDKLITAIMDNTKKLAMERNMSVDAFVAQQKALNVQASDEEMQAFAKLIQRRDQIWNICASVINNTIGYVFKALDFEGIAVGGKNEIIPYKNSTIPLNIKGILDLVADVHGYQLFIIGAFNGDPHPGNILLCDDGRLGLIDYGQCKRLDVQSRVELAKMMIYLRDKNDDMIVKQIRNMGYVTKYNKADVHLEAAKFYFDSDCQENTKGKDFLLFMQDLQERDPIVKGTDEYVIPVRLRMLIGALFYSLGYPFYASEHWDKWATQLLSENAEKQNK